jgi:NCS1 family nucleobase:cation symporter-1
MIGQSLGLPPTMIGFSAMGLVITSAAHQIFQKVPLDQLWKPDQILALITSSTPPPGWTEPVLASGGTRVLVAVMALVGIGIATVSVNIAANVISPANDFANLAPKYISFKMGGLITGIMGVLIMPWHLLRNGDTYVTTWLVGYSALLGPIAGIMVVDYWLIRRTQLDVPDLYRTNGRYSGVNPVAVVALIAGVLPNVPGFLKRIELIGGDPNFFDAIYVYAWFTGFLIAGIGYFVGMRMTSGADVVGGARSA